MQTISTKQTRKHDMQKKKNNIGRNRNRCRTRNRTWPRTTQEQIKLIRIQRTRDKVDRSYLLPRPKRLIFVPLPAKRKTQNWIWSGMLAPISPYKYLCSGRYERERNRQEGGERIVVERFYSVCLSVLPFCSGCFFFFGYCFSLAPSCWLRWRGGRCLF